MKLKKAAILLFLSFLLPIFFTPIVAQPAYVVGQSILLYATMLDDLGNSISGVVLQFEDLTDGVYIGSDETDARGTACVMWDTSSASPGLHTIHVWNAENKDLYVEESHAYIQLKILAPATISYYIQAPSVVKPMEKFVVVVTISNLGEANVEDVVVTLGNQDHKLGTIKGGESTETSFTFIAPEHSGNHTIQGSVCGKEESTGKFVQENFQVTYRVKMEGFGISISAPSTVEENEQFDFSITLNNLGEDDLKIDVQVVLSGAEPTNFSKTLKVPSKRSKRIDLSAIAGTDDVITITAKATSAGLRESDRVSIKVLHMSKRQSSPSALRPTLTPSQTKNPSLPPVTTQIPSWSPNPSEEPLSSAPQATPPLEETISERTESKPEPTEKPASFIVMLAVASVLVMFSFVRKIWRVEEP